MVNPVRTSASRPVDGGSNFHRLISVTTGRSRRRSNGVKKTKQLVVILLGPSGSGKGTQAKFLTRVLYRVHHIETGKLLRRFTKNKSEAARLVQKTMERGGMVSSLVTSSVWMSEVFKKVRPGESIVFDGSPRTLEEAKYLDHILVWLGLPPATVAYVTLTPQETIRRLLLRGRFDDTPVAIRERLRFFKKDVMPVIRYYKKKRRLVTVNGNQPVAGVWKDIRKALKL